MGYVISTSIGFDYSHTIRVNTGDGDNEVKVTVGNEEVYNGVATHIVDDRETLSFKDKDGKEHKYQYRNTYTTT